MVLSSTQKQVCNQIRKQLRSFLLFIWTNGLDAAEGMGRVEDQGHVRDC